MKKKSIDPQWKIQKMPVNNGRNIFGTKSFRFGYFLVQDHLDLVVWIWIVKPKRFIF